MNFGELLGAVELSCLMYKKGRFANHQKSMSRKSSCGTKNRCWLWNFEYLKAQDFSRFRLVVQKQFTQFCVIILLWALPNNFQI